jgi:excisionase family DNA binding protein
MPKPNLDDYLTLAQAAEFMQRSPQTLRRWIRGGDLPGTMRVKQQLLIRREDLMQMFKPVG